MNYKKLSDWNNGFVNWVVHRHPQSDSQQNGFMGGFIFGERGSGKSTYCYKVGAKTDYILKGYNGSNDEEESYKIALKYTLFEPSDFRKLLIYNKLKHIITPVVCLDDASMHFGNMLHMTNPKVYAALLGETATIRTAATGFLINAPKRGHVVKFLRDYDDFKGETKTDGGGYTLTNKQQTWSRKVRFYRWNYYPDETKFRIQIPFQDKYSCFIPEPYYSWYIKKKNYFELKHEIQIADTIDPSVREIFIENENILPSYEGQEDLKKYIAKWKKDSTDEKSQNKIEGIKSKLRMINLKKKIDKHNADTENMEKEGFFL